MLGGNRAHLTGQLGAADGVDLVGVNAGFQAQRFACLQHAAGLLHVENAGFTKDVAVLSQLLLCDGRQRFADHLIHIAVGVVFVFLRHGVGPQEGGGDVHGAAFRQAADHSQLLELRFRIQAVAAFHLAGGNAHGQHFMDKSQRFCVQLVFGFLPGVFHCAQDAAAHAQDIQIPGAGQLQRDLVLSPAAEHQVGMSVDKAGGDQTALGVDDLGALLRPGGGFGLRAAVCNFAVFDQRAGVFYFCNLALLRPGVDTAARGGAKQADIFDKSFVHGVPRFCKRLEDMVFQHLLVEIEVLNLHIIFGRIDQGLHRGQTDNLGAHHMDAPALGLRLDQL